MSVLREKIYKYTVQRLKAGDPPTIREVQRAMGLKAVESARAHLEALVEEGRLVKRDTRSRSYALPAELWSRSTTRSIPILGRVQAGSFTTAVQEAEGFLDLQHSRHEVSHSASVELFALRVRGLSMRDAGLLPEDLIVVRRQSSADTGDIVVALVEEEATVKTLRRGGPKDQGHVVLEAANPDFPDLKVHAEELRLLGKVVEVRRYYENSQAPIYQEHSS